MALAAVPIPEHRAEHAEVAISRPVALDEVADHHVSARELLELRIEEGRDFLVAERGAGIRQVRERGEPQRLAKEIESFAGDE